jgi:branched-chain amino acid transport system ATP-binding protein
VGPNGAGKTTLINTLAGVLRARSGRITFEGRDITALPAHRFCEAGIAIVPEGRRLFGSMSVLREPRDRQHAAGRQGAAREVAGIGAGAVPGVEGQARAGRGRAVRRPAADGGHRPRADGAAAAAAAGRALARPVAADRARDVLGHPRVHAAGTAVLLVEQNVSMALRVADRAYVLEEGRMVAEGTPDTLMQNEEVRRAYLGV